MGYEVLYVDLISCAVVKDRYPILTLLCFQVNQGIKIHSLKSEYLKIVFLHIKN